MLIILPSKINSLSEGKIRNKSDTYINTVTICIKLINYY